MALRSMTGHGRGEAAAGGLRADVELSSVNRKQLDIRLNLPRALLVLEPRVLEQVQATLSRGHVTGSVAVRASAATRRQAVRVDRPLAAAYLRDLRRTAAAFQLDDNLTARDLLAMPDVVTRSNVEDEAARVGPVLTQAVGRALRRMTAMRGREGRALEADLRRRLEGLSVHLDRIRALAPRVTAKYRAQLTARLDKAGFADAARDPQVLKELALFAERSDISEEITRLASHVKQAFDLLRSTQPVGRTLDFLVQEMFREINTIGAKANDVPIVRHVIQFKTELERMREQVQNVE